MAALVSGHFKFLNPQVFDSNLISKKYRDLDREAMNLYLIAPDVYKALYGILQFCDRLSLMICQNEFPDAGRTFEINHSLGNVLHAITEKDEAFFIDPWPFAKDDIAIKYEYHLIKQRSFKNTETFLKAFSQSEIRLNTVIFKN